jgi:hypothetical protein
MLYRNAFVNTKDRAVINRRRDLKVGAFLSASVAIVVVSIEGSDPQ